MAHPVPTKVYLKLIPETAMLFCTLWVHGPTSPYLALSAGTEPKSKGYCRKWHHKLKVVLCLDVSIMYNRLKKSLSHLMANTT